jgi:hypothetical protein
MCTALRGSNHQASKRGVIGEGEDGRGDTCPEKALSSQCALWMPIGDTSLRKVLRYQQTARNRTIQVCPKDCTHPSW